MQVKCTSSPKAGPCPASPIRTFAFTYCTISSKLCVHCVSIRECFVIVVYRRKMIMVFVFVSLFVQHVVSNDHKHFYKGMMPSVRMNANPIQWCQRQTGRNERKKTHTPSIVFRRCHVVHMPLCGQPTYHRDRSWSIPTRDMNPSGHVFLSTHAFVKCRRRKKFIRSLRVYEIDPLLVVTQKKNG